ncbi:MAG: cell surface protein SprA [Bacteroidetes bacterium]|uniref:T9SS outer membrane translocon Sov/SprA n=1 Tax=Phnomibacter sp. TaxID=2836217 RepID=UPI002FDD48AE|nr:cell surface protein SprA [Bacteroidota bacterium]
MSLKAFFSILLCSCCVVLLLSSHTAQAEPFRKFKIFDTDSTKKDSLRYPISDRRGDPYSGYRRNPFDLPDTGYLKQKIEYDPVTKQYYISEKIGNSYYRKPTAITYEDFMRLRGQQMEMENFMRRSNTNLTLNRKLVKPQLRMFDDLFNRIFGNGKIIIQPNGNVDLTAGYQGQNTKNPTLPERARKYGTFDFDMNAQFNMDANIGDKMKLPINFNTLANFDFENQLKLDYKGRSDEIIKSIEAGNMSFATKGTLIQGAQALFGIKTQLQFGKLYVTTALANMQSQRQTANYQGGAALSNFEKKLDDYDENRHFLLAHYFRNRYNRVMSTLPFAQSQVQIMRLEVWVTNRTGQTTDSRDVVGLMDLGERFPFNQNIPPLPGDSLPSNGANGLYGIINNENFRNPANTTNLLMQRGLKPVQDFEKTFARKLIEGTDYIFNRQAGFISINQFLQPDEVLGVAFQYTSNGRVFQVGEFAQDVALDTARGIQKVLFLKLLKATSQRPNLPIWDLMMKNVYSLDQYNIQREGFKVNVLYQEPSGGEKRMLPEGDDPGRPLLRILQLDRLNNRNDPQPDGVFDFIDSFTVQPQQGRIIFPVLEPFGNDLQRLAFAGQPQSVWEKYVFQALYDTIKAIAQQNYANYNRFMLKGQSKASSNDDIYLNAINIPQGSVTVTAGGQILKENVDYVIDYSLGKLTVINQAIKSSGVPVSVNLENNTGFGLQNRGFFGMRLDYLANKNLTVGGTMMRLGERPFFTKMNYGEDPIRNRMYGLDFNYKNDWKQLTRWLDKLPFYSTNTASNIQAYGEAAMLRPGHPPQIGKGENGLIYLDDFEGTRANIDLRFPFVGWTHATTPHGSFFAEADSNNALIYNRNRAKLSWYQIEPVMQDSRNPNNPIKNRDLLSDPRVRQVSNQELFPRRTPLPGTNQLITFDMSFYPKERGAYNYDTRGAFINNDGTFRNPKDRWGGLMRSIDQTDFESANIEFIEFWVQDPFMKTPNFPNGYTNTAGGQLYINLGNISEDIVKDSRRFYENGLPTPSQPNLAVDTTTVWGKTPINPNQITQAFSNDPNDRPFQDVGFDGLNDEEEVLRRRDDFLTPLQTILGPAAFQRLAADPSGDNFVNYRDSRYDASGAGILRRYKDFNLNQGNSPVSTEADLVVASTLYPDNEDLNRDNTLNEGEEFFEYKVDFTPQALQVGQNFITDKRIVSIKYENGTTGTETWYQFRIPIARYTKKVGDIPDFKSIRFMRMYMHGWEDSVTLRFARLDLVRNNWRQFAFDLTRNGTYNSNANNTFTSINTLAVNIEENDRRTPIPYRIPPGIERVQQLANGGVNILQNEQALSMQIRNLFRGEARGVFKNFNNDLRQYKRLNMFIHAEELVNSDPAYSPLTDTSLYASIRIGQDILSNYYEIRIPLKITRPSGPNISPDTIWPKANNLDFSLQELIELKNRRSQNSGSPTQYYSEDINGRIYGVYGNPNLGEVRSIFVGVDNPDRPDGPNLSAEVWINELRLSQIDEEGGWAAVGRVDVQLADLGTLSVAASHRSTGFGTIEQRVNERSREATTQFDASLQIDAGKLVPKSVGLSVPLYASLSKMMITPEYDPYDQDVKMKDKLRTCLNCDSVKKIAREEHVTQTLNISNMRLMPKAGKPIRFYSPSNFDFTYNYLSQKVTSPIVTEDLVKRHRVAVGYAYSTQPKYIEPFKKWVKSPSPWLMFLKDFNFNPMPNTVAIRWDANRQFGRYVPRIVNTFDNKVERVDSTYDKYFNFDRFYSFRWDMSKSFNVDFTALNKARVDEPAGELNQAWKRDSIRTNFLRGGRNVNYDQTVVFAYTLPTQKFPFLDWATARATYTARYKWAASSLLAQQLNQGNILENGADRLINGELDFTKLYMKSKWLAALENQPAPKQKNAEDTVRKKDRSKAKSISKNAKSVTDSLTGKKLTKAERKKARKLRRDERRKERQNRSYEVTGAARVAGKLLTMVKRASINYGEVFNSRIPGYTDSTQYLGNNFRSKAPGMGYIMGQQPDTNYLNKFAQKGLVTRDPLFNQLFAQSFDQKLNVQAQLEPFKEFTIDLNLDKSFSKSYTELFKDTTGTAGHAHLTPYVTGGFSVTYIAFQTLFEKFDPNRTSTMFQNFENYRKDLSLRVAEQNPYWKSTGSLIEADGYARGYNRYAQDVLIPAFIAAYTNKSPNDVALIDQNNSSITANPFRGIKAKPNWRLNFTGLTQLPALQEKFSSINITHSYQGRLSMNSFTSALFYQDPFRVGYPSFIDTTSGNYIPFFLMPNLTISESFEPIIGIDFTTTSQWNARFEYRKSRQLSLSLLDYQLSEVNSTEYIFGTSYRKRGMKLPFRLPKFLNKEGGKELENDITFRFDFSIRDDATSNSRLDQNSSFSTAGQKVIKINPSIDYIMSNRVNIRLFFDQMRSIPYISTSAPTTNTRAGVQVRISLAQ